MKKILLSISVLALFLAVLNSCKKDETPESFADAVAGNYLVKDTVSDPQGCISGSGPISPTGDFEYKSYSIVISKKNDNTVTVSSFDGCGSTFDASVSATSLIALESEPCALVSDVTGAIAGDKIRLTYKTYTGFGCPYSNRATATKQQ